MSPEALSELRRKASVSLGAIADLLKGTSPPSTVEFSPRGSVINWAMLSLSDLPAPLQALSELRHCPGQIDFP